MIELDTKYRTFELRKNALYNFVAGSNNENLEREDQDDESWGVYDYCAIDEYLEKEIDGTFYFMVSYFSCEKNAYEKIFGEWHDDANSYKNIRSIGMKRHYIAEVSRVFTDDFWGVPALHHFVSDQKEAIDVSDCYYCDRPSDIVYPFFEGRENEIIGKYKREIQKDENSNFDKTSLDNGDCLIAGTKEHVANFFRNCSGIRGEYFNCDGTGEYSAIILHEIDHETFAGYVKKYPELELTYREDYKFLISVPHSTEICPAGLDGPEEENAPARDFDKFYDSYNYPWVARSDDKAEGTVVELVEDKSTLFDCTHFTYSGQDLKLKQAEKLYKKITIDDIARVCATDNSTKKREAFLIKFLKEHSLEKIKKVIIHHQGFLTKNFDDLLDDKTASFFNTTHIHYYEKTTFDFESNTAEKSITKRLAYWAGLERKEKILDTFESVPIKGTGLTVKNDIKPSSNVKANLELGYEISRGVLRNVSVVADSFSVPDDVRKIEKFAFISSKIKKIIIGPSVKSIDKKAFVKCSTLKTVEFCKGVSISKLKFAPFAEAKIKRIILPNGVEVSILSDIYYDCFFDGEDGIDFDFVKLAGNIEFAHGNKEEQKIIDDLLDKHSDRVGANIKVLLNAKISFIVGQVFCPCNKKIAIKQLIDKFDISKELNYPYLILQSNCMDDLELATFFLEMSGVSKKARTVEIPCVNNGANLNIKVRFPDNVVYYYTSNFPVSVGDKVFVEGTKAGVPGMVARIDTYAGGNPVVKAFHVKVVDDSNNDLFGLPDSI